MKRAIILVVTLAVMMSMFPLVLRASAAPLGDTEGSDAALFHYAGKDIILENAASLDYEKLRAVADVIACGDEAPDLPCEGSSFWCTLFGHKLTTFTVSEVIANVYTSSPRSVKNIYSVTICKRSSCDHITKTVVSSARISTVPAPGDVNGDGKVSAKDLVIVMKYCAKDFALPERVVDSADLNRDGKVNAKDIVLIMKKIML